MPTAQYKPKDSFQVQFAWRLEDGSYLRAIFEAYILDLYPAADKYLVRLTKWIASADFKKDIKGQFKTKEHSIGIALFLIITDSVDMV